MQQKSALYLKGIPFEKYVSRFFEKCGLGSIVDHNNFDPSIYPNDNHNVVDIVLKDKALIECTNPEPTTFMGDEIMENKLDYFHRRDPFHSLLWVLIVSFAVFSNAIMQRIKQLGIILVVLNEHADKTNRQSFIRHLFRTKLHSIIKRLKPRTKKPSYSSSLTITTIDQYSVTNSSVVNTNSPASVTREHYLHQHQDITADESSRIVKPKIVISNPCQIGHPDHEAWLRRMMERAERIRQ
jgi:hypothetical protein